MIGTKAEARIASNIPNTGKPEGWTLLGVGSYRRAWLSPSGVVYKVQHSTDSVRGGLSENAEEYRNFKRYAQKIAQESGGLCRLAPSYMHADNVIAMEHVPCERIAMVYVESAYGDEWVDDDSASLGNFFNRYNIYDTAGSNVWYDSNGVLTMIDYAG